MDCNLCGGRFRFLEVLALRDGRALAGLCRECAGEASVLRWFRDRCGELYRAGDLRFRLVAGSRLASWSRVFG